MIMTVAVAMQLDLAVLSLCATTKGIGNVAETKQEPNLVIHNKGNNNKYEVVVL